MSTDAGARSNSPSSTHHLVARGPDSDRARFSTANAEYGQPPFALQPIVNIHTGAVFAYQVSARDGQFCVACPQVYAEAIAAFASIPGCRQTRLLLPIVASDLTPAVALVARTEDWRRQQDLHAGFLCFLLCSAVRDGQSQPIVECIERIRRLGHLFAIDGFGAGNVSLRMLYDLAPDLIKIDPFFTSAIARDHRKRLVVNHSVEIAQALGIQVIADSIASANDLLSCRDAGCDFVQGDLIAKPSSDLATLYCSYATIAAITRSERRRDDSDAILIKSQIETLPTLREDDGLHKVFDYFKRYSERSFFPVLDRAGKPLGVVHERGLKAHIYSAYGRELLANKSYRKRIQDFISPCPVADVHFSVQRLLEIHAAAERPSGLIMTEHFSYVGFLSQGALLQIIDQRNLAAARDQNPLTRLPGNNSIVEYIVRMLEEDGRDHCLVYFDFDHFKPFNDQYGFRTGDRAIMLFADLLRKHLSVSNAFIGHIGGDDFFCCFTAIEESRILAIITTLLAQFSHEAQSLYDPVTRRQGYLVSTNRAGKLVRLPLLSCSAGMLFIGAATPVASLDDISSSIAQVKKMAKQSPNGIARLRIES